MFDFIKHAFIKKYHTGVLHDIRSDEAREKDWNHEEIASSPVISYVTKEQAYKNAKIYPVFNQGGESSCVGHGSALEHAIFNIKTDFKGSPEYIYRNRKNYPSEGMFGSDSYEIISKKGICKYSMLPSQGDEKLANALVITPEMDADAAGNKIPGYFVLKKITFDEVASLSSKGKAVKIFINATYKEWSRGTVKPTEIVKHGYAPVCHCVVVLPKTVFTDDEDYIIIQDSAWFGGMYTRQISRSFFDAGRVWFAGYITEVSPPVPGEKPKHTFVLGIKYGQRSDEVKALQNCLIYEGLLSSDCNTGYFGGMTLKAVKLFQVKYKSEILTPIGLTDPTGNVGVRTVNKLNQLYG
jgi:peptidoglycan hydrolase-like protein with peptidoglycan-binding domain